MATLSKDARGFVEGIVSYIKDEGKTPRALPKVQTLLHKVTAQARSQKRATVATSVALGTLEQQQIERLLASLIGHQVVLDCEVDRRLLGGVKIQVGDWIVDTSLLSQLSRLARELVSA